MVLGEPLSVNGLPLSQLTVRVPDDRGSYYLPEEQVLAVEVDDDDVVVTGKKQRILRRSALLADDRPRQSQSMQQHQL